MVSKKYGFSGDVALDSASTIEITENTVCFGQTVFQMKNVTGFGVDRQPQGTACIVTSILALILGVLFTFISSLSSLTMQRGVANPFDIWGPILFLVSVISFLVHFVERPYRFCLYLNSGKTVMFS